MFLRPDFECLQQLVNFILDRLIMRALVARRTAPRGPLFRAQSRKSVDSTSVSSLRRARMLTHVDEVWSSDITYVPMRHGFMYLTAVIDWYSRYVLSWRLSKTLEGRF